MGTLTRESTTKTVHSAPAATIEAPAYLPLAPLLVATDGSEASDEALWAAHAIATKTGQRVELIAVDEPLPVVAPEAQIALGPEAEKESRDALRTRVIGQVARTKVGTNWPMDVVTGQPEAQIASAAKRLGASLVIMGLGEHGVYERIMGDEMVLRVIRLGTVPVLAVAPGFLGLPKRILAATDFSPSSVRAAKLAESLMGPNARITLTHVLSDEIDAGTWSRTSATYFGTKGNAFDQVVASLPADVPIERELLPGDPANALLEYARVNQSDLIATGSHGFGFLTRLWLGSVSQRLVRGARCSVLVAPPEEGPAYADELPEVTTRFASYEWAEQMEEFTRRNAGRSTTMELIDPELGAQIESRSLPLLSVEFDPRDASVRIILGDARFEGTHATRNISDVTAVQVLRGRDGRDLMLRVAHGRGQTLVTLERKV